MTDGSGLPSRIAATIVTYPSVPATFEVAVAALKAQTMPVAVFTHHNTTGANLGFAGGHNRLLNRVFTAGYDAAIVHNPDASLEPTAVAALHRSALEHPLCLLGPVLEQADDMRMAPTGLADTLGIRWTRDARHLDIGQGEAMPFSTGFTTPDLQVSGVSGACIFITRSVYEWIVAASGEFFDADFIAYREDAELAIRAEVLGISSWCVPSAMGHHIRSQRGTARGRDALVDLLGVRNRFLIAAKWGRRRPGLLPLAVFRDVVVVLAVLVRERSSVPGLVQAWGLRHTMRQKRDRVLAWSRDHPPIAT